MSILFFNRIKNYYLLIIVVLLIFQLIHASSSAQNDAETLYSKLSDKLSAANKYKSYIPEEVLTDSQELIDRINNGAYYNNNELLKIRINNQIDLLDIYIINSEKKIDLSNIEKQIM